MKKQITLSLVVALLFAMSVNSSAADVTIRFKAPVDWTTVNLYVYGTTEIMGGWPGRAVTKDADGLYSITYDNTGIAAATGIFNNGAGGQQTAGFDALTTNCWQANVLTGTEYSIGVMTCPNVIPEPVTVRFKAPVEWVDVYFYIWGTNNSLVGGWPGTKMTLDTDGFYAATFDKTGITAANGIFNNNSGVQTASIDVLAGGCFEATTLSGTEYAVAALVCPNAAIVNVGFKAPAGWTDVYFYIWGTNNSLVGAWPGTKMTVGTGGFYIGTFDKTGITAANGIFNNNSGVQTASIDVLAGGCFEATTLSGTEYAVATATCPAAGVNELQQEHLSVYPNPISDRLNFATPENISRVSIHSVTGENVMTVSNLSKSGTVDVSSIKSGIYFVNINFADGKQKTEKIIKL